MAQPYLKGALVGAALGGAIGYFYFTKPGRRALDAFTAMLEQAAVDAYEIRSLWSRFHRAADEYQFAVSAAVSEGMPEPDEEFMTPDAGRG